MNKVIYRVISNAIDTGIDIFNDTGVKINKIKNWVIENPQASISIISSIALLLRASQSLVVSQRVYSERHRKDYTYYDRSSGHRWKLRRKLNNTDRAIIDHRKKNGDEVFNILSDLGVI